MLRAAAVSSDHAALASFPECEAGADFFAALVLIDFRYCEFSVRVMVQYRH